MEYFAWAFAGLVASLIVANIIRTVLEAFERPVDKKSADAQEESVW